MSNLTIFNFENTPVQTIVENNEIFFRAAQLAELLQYKNPHKAIKDHVDSDDLTKREIVNTVNKRAQVLFVNESGMYSLVLSSKLEQAKKVKRWITSEVLPAIRKTGKYQLQPKQLALPEPEKKFTFEFTEYELQTVAWACFAFRRNNNLLHELYSPLAAIGSKFAVEARDNAVEYRNTLRRFNEVVKRITVDIEADPETNWRVLKHIRSFNEKIFGKVETTI
jgi:genome